MIPINISIHLKFPGQKERAAWVILMVGKKGDDNGSQGVNRTEMNGVIQMNCLTMAGQSPRRACPQTQERICRLVTFIKIK